MTCDNVNGWQLTISLNGTICISKIEPITISRYGTGTVNCPTLDLQFTGFQWMNNENLSANYCDCCSNVDTLWGGTAEVF